jgi:hypothetical protein
MAKYNNIVILITLIMMKPFYKIPCTLPVAKNTSGKKYPWHIKFKSLSLVVVYGECSWGPLRSDKPTTESQVSDAIPSPID